MDVCIKNVNDKDWRLFKAEAIKNDLKIGEMFNKLVEGTIDKKGKSNWDEVLYGKNKLNILTQKDLKKIRTEFRKNFKLRI
mgnify:CR=1 FL=1|tara:strand:- start:11083 stop:11325 length:243 start_codon:yes stop_codon:yes gene_type:complete